MTIISNDSSYALSGQVVARQRDSRPALTGYWHNWHMDSAAFIPLRNVSASFDVINVAFAVADANRAGRLVFEPCPQTTRREIRDDIAVLQNSGRKVLLSVGGANMPVVLEGLSSSQEFSNSLESLLDEYGFDGLDIDLEGAVRLEAGDTDFRNPVSPSVIHLIEAIFGLKNRRGDAFILSLAPQVAYVQGGFCAYQGLRGSYLPVIERLRDILDCVHVQYYNAFPQKALDGQFYDPDSPDFHVAMTEMLLLGFPVAGSSDPNHFFAPLRPEQVGIGLPSCKAIIQNGYVAPENLQNMLSALSGRSALHGSYQLQNPAGYPGFGALMTWSINWDAAAGFAFSAAARRGLDVLPG